MEQNTDHNQNAFYHNEIFFMMTAYVIVEWPVWKLNWFFSVAF